MLEEYRIIPVRVGPVINNPMVLHSNSLNRQHGRPDRPLAEVGCSKFKYRNKNKQHNLSFTRYKDITRVQKKN